MRIEWNKVTWYSKLVAVIVFLATAALFFALGTMYGSATATIDANLAAINAATSTTN